VDHFDRKILAMVQRDCTLRAEVIAEEVGLSASAVQRRLRHMRQEKIISAEVAIVDGKAVGQEMTFIAGMEIERENYNALARLRQWVEGQENIQQLYYVTGSVDLVAIIVARDVAEYDELTAHIMRENPQIRRINTNVVLKPVKTGLYVPTGV
jgi:DNA-binding Lrp family transcriptional regulator